ncbi:MAG: hypothetical protein GY696_40555 [Gammaproteobacteria bacterium]|nr:hypothetical protein [Gammaproteobacteria bacterium]
MDPHSRLFILHSSKIACSRFFPLSVQDQEGWVAIIPYLVWQQEPGHLPANKVDERTPPDLMARGLTNWAEDQDRQERFWWPSHQKSTLRDLAYGDCIWAGECKGAEGEDLPLYVLADLKTERKGSMDDGARGLL